MKKILKLLLCAAVICSFALFTIPGAARARTDIGFTISDYDVQANISENNVYDITETIKVNFSEAKHGIFREIPVNRELTRTAPDGTQTKTKVRTSVSDVKVEGYNYSTSDDNYTVTIKIGDANKTVTGEQTYKLSYKYTFGDDGSKEFDEAYYNILGTDWDTTIDHFTFSVTLPKPFDTSKLGFSMGAEGTTGYDPNVLKFSVDGNTITGTVTQQIRNYQGVTMRAELPQGYFNLKIPDWIMMGIMGVILLAGLLLFLIFGTDRKPLKIVEFNPPDGMNPTETGYVYDGSVDDRDVVSLLIYWADKGYLTIGGKGAVHELKKVKDIGKDARPYEKDMFNKLFEKGPSVTTTQLTNSFYKTISSVKSTVEAEYKNDANRIFTKISMRLAPYLSLLAVLPIWLSWSMVLDRVGEGLGFTIPMTLVIGTVMMLPALYIIGLIRRWNTQKPKSRRTKLIAASVFFIGFIVAFLVISLDGALEPLQPICAVTTSVILCLCAGFIQRRTPKGREWLGKILGLRDFILLAERDKLIKLVDENPNYFYHVLPYAYVLNVTDKWAKQFESIAVEPPDWYDGEDEDFKPWLFVTNLNNSMSSFESHMTSAPVSHSSGGGGGGGGFSSGSSSGGGGGGGGGGSW